MVEPELFLLSSPIMGGFAYPSSHIGNRVEGRRPRSWSETAKNALPRRPGYVHRPEPWTPERLSSALQARTSLWLLVRNAWCSTGATRSKLYIPVLQEQVSD